MSFPALTKTQHNDTYPSIDPGERPELSLKGKTVIVTGGGTGIGRGITQAFADAGAKRIAILGRRENLLQETKRVVEANNASVEVTTHATDLVDASSVEKAAGEIGSWDVLVSNAAYLTAPGPILEADREDWWRAFEVNIKGNFNLARSFVLTKRDGAVFVGVNSGSLQIPQMQAGLSAYNASKIGALKLLETLGTENPDLHVVNMHPGVVASDMSAKFGVSAEHAPDTPLLAGHFAVWLCSEEAKFLRGRFLWCNWDADELKAKKDQFEENPLLTTSNCIGFPYQP